MLNIKERLNYILPREMAESVLSDGEYPRESVVPVKFDVLRSYLFRASPTNNHSQSLFSRYSPINQAVAFHKLEVHAKLELKNDTFFLDGGPITRLSIYTYNKMLYNFNMGCDETILNVHGLGVIKVIKGSNGSHLTDTGSIVCPIPVIKAIYEVIKPTGNKLPLNVVQNLHSLSLKHWKLVEFNVLTSSLTEMIYQRNSTRSVQIVHGQVALRCAYCRIIPMSFLRSSNSNIFCCIKHKNLFNATSRFRGRYVK